MRYVSLIVFIAALVWSWNLIHSASAISNEVHVDLQREMLNYISKTVQEKNTNATNIIVHNIWSEPFQDSKVKVSFDYSYDDTLSDGTKAKQEIKGWVVLLKDEKSGDSQKWVFDEKEKNFPTNAITFEGSLVTAGEEEAPASNPAPETATPPSPHQ